MELASDSLIEHIIQWFVLLVGAKLAYVSARATFAVLPMYHSLATTYVPAKIERHHISSHVDSCGSSNCVHVLLAFYSCPLLGI